MSADFEIRAGWEKLERGSPEDRACFSQFGIRYRNTWLSEADDDFVGRIRPQVYLSAYGVAEWLAWNWWRLRWEPKTHAPDWGLAHHMTTIGGGYVWPNVTIFSDSELVILVAKPTKPRPNEPIRYVSDVATLLSPSTFESGVDQFIEQVLGQLREEKLAKTNLSEVWANVLAERADPDLTTHRKLEALLGCDPDEADEAVIDALIKDSEAMGSRAMEEVAANPTTRGNAVFTASRLREIAQQGGLIRSLAIP